MANKIYNKANALDKHRASMASLLAPLNKNRALIADPLKEHRASMASLLAPLSKNRALIADPLKEHRASMASLLAPLNKHLALTTSIGTPLKEHRASMASLLAPLNKNRALMTSLLAPLNKHLALTTSIGTPLKEHRALMASIATPPKMKEFRVAIMAISDPFKDLSIFHSTSLKSLKDVALDTDHDVSIEADGLISLSSKQIAFSELQELSRQIIYESSLAISSTLEESINNLVKEIRLQKNPLMQKILMWFIYPLIISIIMSFINPVMDYHVKSYLNNDKRTLSKQLKNSVKSSIAEENLLNEFRYVSANILNVRYSASQKSESIGNLRFGYMVIVRKRRKSWTLIEWNDPDTEIQIKGWVFSRYLAKFK